MSGLSRSLILLLCLSQFSLAQEISIESRMLLDGVAPYQPAGDYLLVPEDSTPTLEPVGFVSLTLPAATTQVTVIARAGSASVEPELLPSDPLHPVYIVRATGKVWIFVTVIDFDEKVYITKQEDLVIGPPTPPPPPLPEIDFEAVSRSAAPDEPETKAHLIRNISAVIDSSPGTVSEAVDMFQLAIQNALLLRPRGSQADWKSWRVALEEAYEKTQPDLPTLLASYQAVIKGLQ